MPKRKAKKDLNTTTKKNKVSDSDLIYNYMLKQNRPYNHTAIFSNLHEQVKKKDVQRILESLTKKGKLVKKEFGRNKIYLVSQDNFVEADKDDLKQLSFEIRDEEKNVEQLLKIRTQLMNQNDRFEKLPLNKDIDVFLDDLKNKVNVLETELENKKKNQVVVSQKDLRKTQILVNAIYKEWRKRAKAGKEMHESLVDQFGKDKVAEEIELDRPPKPWKEYKNECK